LHAAHTAKNARRPVAVVARFEVAASFDSQEWPDAPGEVWCPPSEARGSVDDIILACGPFPRTPFQELRREDLERRVMQACADGARSASCTKDDACKAHSSYCNEARCVCLALPAKGPAPACKGPSSVKCLVDPCAGKASKCVNNACIVVSK